MADTVPTKLTGRELMLRLQAMGPNELLEFSRRIIKLAQGPLSKTPLATNEEDGSPVAMLFVCQELIRRYDIVAAGIELAEQLVAASLPKPPPDKVN